MSMLKLVQMGSFWKPIPGKPAQLHMLACLANRSDDTLFTQVPLSLKDGQKALEHARRGGLFRVTLELVEE